MVPETVSISGFHIAAVGDGIIAAYYKADWII